MIDPYATEFTFQSAKMNQKLRGVYVAPKRRDDDDPAWKLARCFGWVELFAPSDAAVIQRQIIRDIRRRATRHPLTGR